MHHTRFADFLAKREREQVDSPSAFTVYASLLEELSANVTRIQKRWLEQLKVLPCLLADDGSSTTRAGCVRSGLQLHAAYSIYLVDNAEYERLLHPLTAPRQLQQLLPLYKALGCPWLSSAVERCRLHPLLCADYLMSYLRC